MKIVVIVLFLAGLYYVHTQIMEQMPASAKTTSSASSSPSSTVKKRHVNGMTMISQDEYAFISEQVSKKYEKQDFSAIKLADGTRIPVKFTPNGRICPRTKLPEGNVTLDAKLAVVR